MKIKKFEKVGEIPVFWQNLVPLKKIDLGCIEITGIEGNLVCPDLNELFVCALGVLKDAAPQFTDELTEESPHRITADYVAEIKIVNGIPTQVIFKQHLGIGGLWK